jgi:mannose-6-phosphate isomerase
MSVANLKLSRPLPVIGTVQSYAWGKIGATSRIYPFLEGFEATKPLAEYWLGAHPKAPAEVILPDDTRIGLDLLFQDGQRLSCMLKVLSINPDYGLSIQSHPDSRSAQLLHAREPHNYPDPFHKPEMGVALTPVTLLYGFRPLPDIARVLERFPEIRQVWGESFCYRLAQAVEAYDPVLMREMLSLLLRADRTIVVAAVEALMARWGDGVDTPPEMVILRRLYPRYGAADVGLIALFVMNIVSVSPGLGVFIGPNIPHAYLDGDLVECMACSDNVIRAGLTTKYTDVESLLETVSFESATRPSLLRAKGATHDFAFFDVPVSDFSLGVVEEGSGVVTCQARAEPSLLFVLGEEATVQSLDSGVSVRLGDGGAVLLPGSSGAYEVKRKNASLFWAGSGR